MKLTGNTILITGGSSGIGLEFVRQLSALKNTVLVTGRDVNKLEKIKSEFPQAHIFQSDVSDPAAIQALYEKVLKDFPALNMLINNAGVMRTINLLQESTVDLSDLTREIDINLHGPIRMCKQFLPHLKRQETAAIVNVSSGLAFSPLPTSPVYCATKAGLHSFTLSLRMQLQRTPVKVFELAPPATKTELLGRFEREKMKGIVIMPVDKMVHAALKGMEKDHFEICPGQSNQLKLMSRIAPEFTLKQMSRPVEKMLSGKRS